MALRRGWAKGVYNLFAVANDGADLLWLGISESNDDQVELRADENALTERAAAIEQTETAGDRPEVSSVRPF